MCASAHAPVHGERGEGRTDKAGPRRSERKGDAWGQRLGTCEPGPRERERESERAKKLAPTGWPQRVESERERARERTAADRRGPPVRRRERAA
jgi:hypothetical protein